MDDVKEILIASFTSIIGWPKAIVVRTLIRLRDRYSELEARVKQLEQENAKLKEQLEQGKISVSNREVNKPSSKQGEWEKDSPGD